MTDLLPTICIIDDDLRSARLLRTGLRDEYLTHIFTCPKAAYKQLPDLAPDLILLDIEMPEIDGYNLCHKLKNCEATASIPIIFVTGHSGAEEPRAFDFGADDFVNKPVNLPKLKARIARAIQNGLYISFLEHLVEHKDIAIQALKTQDSGLLEHV